MGYVFRQAGRRHWMLKYYSHGRAIVESSGTAVKDEATDILRKREGAIADGVPSPNRPGRLRFAEAARDIINDYTANNYKSIDELRRRLRLHLTPYFGHRKLATITTSDVRSYIAHRFEGGVIATRGQRKGERVRDVSAAEINRELTVLKRMFTLAVQAGTLHHRPHIPLLEEHNVRVGFLEADQCQRVCNHLPAELRPVVAFAFITGWRVPSEILPLEWRQVDFEAGEVRLDPGTTKNREGRVFKMTAALRQLLQTQRIECDRIKRESDTIVPWVFFRMIANGRRGPKRPRRIKTLTKAWAAACIAAGLPGRILHDLRRSSIRNMVRAGVPERVAMTLSGHKTRSVFDRYNIVSEGDLTEAARRLDTVASPVLERQKTSPN